MVSFSLGRDQDQDQDQHSEPFPRSTSSFPTPTEPKKPSSLIQCLPPCKWVPGALYSLTRTPQSAAFVPGDVPLQESATGHRISFRAAEQTRCHNIPLGFLARRRHSGVDNLGRRQTCLASPKYLQQHARRYFHGEDRSGTVH